jgi:hypothetical protein
MKLYIIILVLALVQSIRCFGEEKEREIFWPKSKEYSAAVHHLKYDEKQARELLLEGTRGSAGVYFDHMPLFIYKQEYCFGIPEKTRIPVAGYYVDGNTGAIALRKSSKYIQVNREKLPLDAFESEQVIKK